MKAIIKENLNISVYSWKEKYKKKLNSSRKIDLTHLKCYFNNLNWWENNHRRVPNCGSPMHVWPLPWSDQKMGQLTKTKNKLSKRVILKYLVFTEIIVMWSQTPVYIDQNIKQTIQNI